MTGQSVSDFMENSDRVLMKSDYAKIQRRFFHEFSTLCRRADKQGRALL